MAAMLPHSPPPTPSRIHTNAHLVFCINTWSALVPTTIYRIMCFGVARHRQWRADIVLSQQPTHFCLPRKFRTKHKSKILVVKGKSLSSFFNLLPTSYAN